MDIEFVLPEQAKKRQKPQEIAPLVQHVMPGQIVTTEAGFLRGHGTYVQDTKLIATVSGVVERVNKLISVRPLKARYQGEVGDVVVGRIVDVGQKRWKVDVNSRQDAVLMLAAINLPGGIQRRRTNVDERNMRSFFVEDDLISAEVQQFYSDGAMALHTRSARYGKLTNGQFLSVPPALVKRTKQSFYTFPFGVEVILGNNGYIWIAPASLIPDENDNTLHSQDIPVNENKEEEVSYETREKICRVRNAIVALATEFIAIHVATISDVVDESFRLGFAPKDMLKPEPMSLLVRVAAQRKSKPTQTE